VQGGTTVGAPCCESKAAQAPSQRNHLILCQQTFNGLSAACLYVPEDVYNKIWKKDGGASCAAIADVVVCCWLPLFGLFLDGGVDHAVITGKGRELRAEARHVLVVVILVVGQRLQRDDAGQLGLELLE